MLNSIHVMKLQRMKSSMMQWINLLQNNRFVFTVVAFVVPKTGPIHLVLVGLTAGWQTKTSIKKLKVITRLLMHLSRCTNRLMASFSNDDYYTINS